MRILTLRRRLILLQGLIVLCSVPGRAQTPASSGAFVLLSGTDTVSTQHFTRTGNVLTGQMNVRQGTPVQVNYSIEFGSGSEPVRMRDSESADLGTLQVDAEFSARAIRYRASATGSPDRKQDFDTPGPARPMTPVLIPTVEQLLRVARPGSADSVQVLTFNIRQGDTATASIRRITGDSVAVKVKNVTMRLAVSREGDVLGGLFVNPTRTLRLVRVSDPSSKR